MHVSLTTKSSEIAEKKTLRRLVYEDLHTLEGGHKRGERVRKFLTWLIVLSIVVVMLETMQNIHASYGGILYGFELVIVAFFSVEYILRVWSIVEAPHFRHPVLGRLRYCITFYAVVDLLAVLPFFLSHAIALDFATLRALRLVRLIRVFKIGEYSHSLAVINRVLHKTRHNIITALFIIGIILVMSSSLMYVLEHDVQPEAFSSIPASLWWGIATLATIGYGDVIPMTVAGRICSGIISVLGIGVFALPSAFIVTGLMDELQKKHRHHTCPNCHHAFTENEEAPQTTELS